MNSDKQHILKALVTIVDRDKVKYVTEVCRSCHLFFSIAINAYGTAPSEILDVLGIGDVDKTVVVSILPGFYVGNVMKALDDRLKLRRHGTGIVFTVPLSGAGGHFSERLEQISPEIREQIMKKVEKSMDKAKSEHRYGLILAVVNEGFSDDVMTAAKSAGARGGTVFSARRIGMEGAMTFFGMEIQPEKEVVAILVEQESKHAIMQAVNTNCGMRTEARGAIFSLPVDNMIGTDEADYD